MNNTCSRIRSAYPHPKPLETDDDDCISDSGAYCIGGAFCMYLKGDGAPKDPKTLNESIRFPNVHYLTDALAAYTPQPPHKAAWYSKAITKFNDEEEFETAWTLLDCAIKGLHYDEVRKTIQGAPSCHE